MALENATIMIGLGIGIIYLFLYRKNNLLGSLAMIGLGVLTLFYANKGIDNTAYGILGWIVVAVGVTMIIDYLLQPVKKKRK